MHTFTCSKGFTIHYNSDLSGNVEIVRPDKAEAVKSFWVPASTLVEFVARHVANERISALEQATPGDILGIKWP